LAAVRLRSSAVRRSRRNLSANMNTSSPPRPCAIITATSTRSCRLCNADIVDERCVQCNRGSKHARFIRRSRSQQLAQSRRSVRRLRTSATQSRCQASAEVPYGAPGRRTPTRAARSSAPSGCSPPGSSGSRCRAPPRRRATARRRGCARGSPRSGTSLARTTCSFCSRCSSARPQTRRASRLGLCSLPMMGGCQAPTCSMARLQHDAAVALARGNGACAACVSCRHVHLDATHM
jgi:hypothetical protein